MARTARENRLAGTIEMSQMTGTMLEDGKDFNQTDVEFILTYLMGVIGMNPTNDKSVGKSILEQATRYTQNAQIKALGTSVIGGEFRCINIVMVTDEDDPEYLGQWHMDDENGVFGYVYNADAPELSELGYMFYAKKPRTNRFRRIA